MMSEGEKIMKDSGKTKKEGDKIMKEGAKSTY